MAIGTHGPRKPSSGEANSKKLDQIVAKVREDGTLLKMGLLAHAVSQPGKAVLKLNSSRGHENVSP